MKFNYYFERDNFKLINNDIFKILKKLDLDFFENI